MIKHTCHATHWYIVNDSWMVGWGAVKKTFEWLNWLNVFEGIGFGWSIILQITFMRKKQKKWEQLNPPKPLTNDGRQSPHVSRGREQVSRHAFFHRLRHRTVPNCALVWQCVTVCDTVQRQSSAFLGASWPPWCCRCSWPPVGSRSTKGELGLFFRFWTCLNCASIFRGIPKSNKQ